MVKFVPRKGDPQAELELEYDIALAKAEEKGVPDKPLANPAY